MLRVVHLGRPRYVSVCNLERSAAHSGTNMVASKGLLAMAQTGLVIVSPGETARLRQESAIHLLPSSAIVLDDRLVGHTESVASC